MLSATRSAQYNSRPVPVPDCAPEPDGSPVARVLLPSDAPPPEALHDWAQRLSDPNEDWPDLEARRQLVASLAEALVASRDSLCATVCATLPASPQEFALVELEPLARCLREAATARPRPGRGAGFEVAQASALLAIALSPAMGWGAAVAVGAQAFLEGAAVSWLCPDDAHAGLSEAIALARRVGFPHGAFARHESALDGELAMTLRAAGIRRALWMADARDSRGFQAEAIADGLATQVHDVGSTLAVVRRDADLQRAAEVIVGARLRLGSSRFDGAQRVLVDAAVHDAFAARLTDALARAARDPLVQYGLTALPLAARAALTRRLDDALGHGARLLVGSAPLPAGPAAPCLLSVPAAHARTVAPWVPAPLLALVPYAHDDDALSIARSAPLGAVASVFGVDESRALDLAARLDVDVVHLNDAPDGGLALLGPRAAEGFASRTLRVLPATDTARGRRYPPYQPLWVRTTGLRLALTEGRHGLRGRLGELW